MAQGMCRQADIGLQANFLAQMSELRTGVESHTLQGKAISLRTAYAAFRNGNASSPSTISIWRVDVVRLYGLPFPKTLLRALASSAPELS